MLQEELCGSSAAPGVNDKQLSEEVGNTMTVPSIKTISHVSKNAKFFRSTKYSI